MSATAGAPALVGLTSAEAQERLERDGPNRIPAPKRPGAIRQILGQLTHFFALLLWVGGALAIIGGMAQLGVAIFVVIVVNGLFSYVQQSRAERAAERLQDLLPRRVTVERDGQETTIDAADLVVGDLVILADGDRISADLDVIEARGLDIDTSMLTGESAPVTLADGETAAAGTFVTQGQGRAVVRATAGDTRLAAIARLTQTDTHRRTPLALEINRVVRIIAGIALAVGIGFFGVSLLVGTPANDGFLFAIGVTVALVPEGLLPTVTLSLAMGAQRMARQHALVRGLESVETLGSATFICTDKTGTLTRNEMTITRVWIGSGPIDVDGAGYDPTVPMTIEKPSLTGVVDLARAARACSTGHVISEHDRWIAQGDPMEVAIDVLARRCGVDIDPQAVLDRFPFDPHRRRESAILRDGDGLVLVVKGAPETVLARCVGTGPDVEAGMEHLAKEGLRVIAVASRTMRPDEAPDDSSPEPDILERELTLLGLLGFQDPPREGTTEAIRRCREAGIEVAMLTGDHPLTAAAIAEKIGLRRVGDPVVDGAALPDDIEALGRMVDHDGVVISRIDPEDKLRVAQALQARGHVVAMTGDGVNDGPALHAADIGIAMGRSGTDVARAAADLVLLDDEFRTIVTAVEQGRSTFADIRRFLTYHLTDNVAELTPFVLWAVSGGRFPLAIGVLQVLCLDIGTDLLPALALGAEPAHGDAVAARTVGSATSHLFDRTVLRRAFLILGPVEAVTEIGAFLTSLWFDGWRPGDSFPTGASLATASGAAFTAVVLGQFANAFACRSTTKRPGQIGWFTNRLVLGAVAVEMVALCGFLFIGPIARALGHRPPSVAGFVVAIAAIPLVLAADALDKAHRNRRTRRSQIPPTVATVATQGATS